MRSQADARFAFLRDPDLYDLVLRVIFKIIHNESDAEDARQGSYVLAMQLVRTGKGPRAGFERGWMCRVAKNHAHNAFRKLVRQEAPVDEPDDLDIPVEDRPTLLAEQLRVERLLDATAAAAAEHPEKAADVLVPDGRSGRGSPADSATRKRKERARTFFAAAIGAAVAAAVLFLVMRRAPHAPPGPLPLLWNDTTLATASRELAARSCAGSDARACLTHLEDARRLDPPRFGAAEQSARVAAIARLRASALGACGEQKWTECLAGLDDAQRYDPDGDREPLVQLARSEAAVALAKGSPSPSDLDSKGPLPR